MKQIGIIGFGRIGKVHARSIKKFVKGAVVKSICDPMLDDEKIKFADDLGIHHCFTDYHEILNDKDIDIVLVCSSTNTHAAISIEAAQAKKHIFCEKPIDTEIEKIQAVIKAVEENGVKFQVGFNRRFDHNFKALHSAVVNNKIGDPHFISIVSRDPDAPSLDYVKVSGGMFLDMTIHDFDMARYIVGNEVTEVYTKAAVLVDPEIGKAGDVDTAIITLTFANGAIGVIDNSRKAVYGYDQRVEIFGSKGMACADNNYPENHRYFASDGVHGSLPLNFFMERYLEAYANEMKIFCESVINNLPLPVSGNDGLMSVAIAMAAKKSYLENRPVELSEFL